jgi:AcrR family transcriptional regulator
MPPDDAKRYHHGELRAALVAAALEVLERDGPQALSLRALARTVGVSSMAPYHHFADRDALLAAVATSGFERLQQRKLDIAAQASVAEALSDGAADYVAFILDNPNLYRLMKGPQFADRARYPDLHHAAAAPAQILLGLITTLLEQHQLRRPTAEDGALLLWGLAHGIGTLALDGQLPADRAAALARKGAKTMIEGWIGATS